MSSRRLYQMNYKISGRSFSITFPIFSHFLKKNSFLLIAENFVGQITTTTQSEVHNLLPNARPDVVESSMSKKSQFEMVILPKNNDRDEDLIQISKTK